MTPRDVLERLLTVYGDYYNIERDHPAEPFAAEAVFHSHEEQYFLIRAVPLSEAESSEYVFFALADVLTADRLRALAETAWQTGIARVRPGRNHRNSDVSLIVLAEHADPAALLLAPNLRYYRSYRCSLRGWSHFLLFAAEISTGRCAWNRQGRRLREIVQSNIDFSEKGAIST